MKQLWEFIIMVLACALVSFILYLCLMDSDRKPTTYKEWTLEHFLNK